MARPFSTPELREKRGEAEEIIAKQAMGEGAYCRGINAVCENDVTHFKANRQIQVIRDWFRNENKLVTMGPVFAIHQFH
jgi:hypothetical protein